MIWLFPTIRFQRKSFLPKLKGVTLDYYGWRPNQTFVMHVMFLPSSPALLSEISVIDTPEWIMSLVAGTASSTHHSSSTLLSSPVFVGGSFLSVGGERLPHSSPVSGRPICHQRSLQFRAVHRERQAWAGRPASWLLDFSLCSQLQNCPQIGFVSSRAAGFSRYQL